MTEGKKKRSWKEWASLVVLSLAIAFVTAEVVLRIVPMRYTDFHSSFVYTGDTAVGYLPVANQEASYNLACLRNGLVRTNADGMRGAAWGDSRSPRIALLGDSYLLALTVSDRWHVANLLQASTGGDVWNAGVSGYGTYQEYLLWHHRIAPRRPDVTVVFLFPENDIRDNNCTLCRAEGQIYSPCLEVQNGRLTPRMDFQRREAPKGVKSWLMEHCYTCRVVRNIRREQNMPPPTGKIFEQESFAYNVYRPGHSPQWDAAWQGTEFTLQRLKTECDSVGSKLLVVLVPGMLTVARDWKAELNREVQVTQPPSDFDLAYPTARLHTLLDSAGVAYLDLLPEFLAYRDRYDLQDPLFGWCCDGHWNPVAHRIAGDRIHDRLVRAGWLQGALRGDTPAPEAILGAELMRQIYGCEVVTLD